MFWCCLTQTGATRPGPTVLDLNHSFGSERRFPGKQVASTHRQTVAESVSWAQASRTASNVYSTARQVPAPLRSHWGWLRENIIPFGQFHGEPYLLAILAGC